MISKIEKYNNGQDDWRYKAINAYKKVENPEDWECCPKCELIPKVWEFDNGRSTACGCGESKYNHHSIHAESIRSVMENSHNGTSMEEYNLDELRKNWNHWCNTGEVLFKAQPHRMDKRW